MLVVLTIYVDGVGEKRACRTKRVKALAAQLNLQNSGEKATGENEKIHKCFILWWRRLRFKRYICKSEFHLIVYLQLHAFKQRRLLVHGSNL